MKINRWQVLIASTAVLLCTGSVYAFSVFAAALAKEKGWEMDEIMTVFVINTGISPIPMILGGRLLDRGYAKQVIGIGSLLFALGFFLSSFATSLGMLTLTYGILAGFGQGLAYSGALSNSIKLFPDKRGLASGIITAGMGGAAIIAAPLANALIERGSVSTAFNYLGLAYIGVSVITFFFIKSAPAGYKPEGWEPPKVASGPSFDNKNWLEMLKTPFFYLIFGMMATGAFSGLMITSNASSIGQSMFKLTAATAAIYVSLASLSNCLGRIIWGVISDKIGRNKSYAAILIAVIVAFVVLLSVKSVVGFAIGIIILGMCFGGVMGIFPPMVMENYGPVNQGTNYGIVFSAYSLAGMFAAKTAAQIADANNGDFSKAFYLAIGLAVVGFIINLIYMNLKKVPLAKLSER
ncbi:L-lactate MFS transporter [Marinilactibacillus kalidii]|uniref:L-lactate MFS transporter n=1 Tax=Marinilactibacillus kalidii TaxID=2820274 RepID=UPI001ABDD87D|nr:OFA family MFS transporter [Marinilactibacillus kalidii]